MRGYVRPQCELLCDGVRELEPFPLDTPLPLLEWGTNYALATRLFCYLLLHAGVVERGGRAIVMPAMPGSGKSTLTAALTLRGFRLLSDEFGVVRLSDARLLRMLRPLALKNESIDVIQRFEPTAVIGPRFPKTHKGTVAHLAPLAIARRRAARSRQPGARGVSPLRPVGRRRTRAGEEDARIRAARGQLVQLPGARPGRRSTRWASWWRRVRAGSCATAISTVRSRRSASCSTKRVPPNQHAGPRDPQRSVACDDAPNEPPRTCRVDASARPSGASRCSPRSRTRHPLPATTSRTGTA